MSSDFKIISKIEAAERQLAQAIRMFFDRADAVSIHTLASAAYQILIDICKSRAIPREMEDSAILMEMGVKKDVIAALREPQNFFKHSHQGNPEETVRFSPKLSAYMMVSAARYHYIVTGRQMHESIVLQMWFYASHPERAPEQIRPFLKDDLLDPKDLEFFAGLIKK
jgi:hypothetical protein